MKLLPVSIALLALGACSSKSSPAAPALQADAAITVDNAVDVTRAMVASTIDVVRVARICARFVTVAPPPPPPPGTLAAEITQTFSGPSGGQAIHTWNDVDGDMEPSTGDVFTTTFAAYVDGYQLSGTVMFDEVVVVGKLFDGTTWSFESRLHFINLSVTTNGISETWNGSMLCTREQRLTVKLLTLQADSDFRFGALTLAAGARLERNEYPIDFSMGIFVQAFVRAPALGGGFEVETVAPLTGIQALPNPFAGSLEVRGANDSVLHLLPVDFFNVEIHVDADGDGMDDATLAAEWADL